MSYYTERHGMRKPINKTYEITPQEYSLLLKCCEKYYDNIAWRFPEQCPDGCGCCGLDYNQFNLDLKYEIPGLYRSDSDQIATPSVRHNFFSNETTIDDYDPFSLLDYIEFFAQNCRDVVVTDFHRYFGHHHLHLRDTDSVFKQFQTDINDIFRKTGLLYHLTDSKIIERIVENTPLTQEIENAVLQIAEKGTKDLLEEAIVLYKQPYPESSRDAAEKIWDAYERLKSYYTSLDKKESASKIVDDMAGGNSALLKLFNDEFKALTDIGNGFRIRHHETNKVDITDPRHYDYFFNRCLSLIALAIQYLQ